MADKYFPKVRAAREALLDRATEILETYLAIIAEARAAGDFKVAAENTWRLIEHMPRDETGLRIIDESAAMKTKDGGSHAGPTIQIGISLAKPKELPQVKVIDIDDEEVKS